MAIQVPSATSSFVNNTATGAINRTNEQLASGSRINKAADDVAGLLIADRLTSEINGNQQAVANAINGNSMLQVASGGLDQVNESLQQLRELGVQAGNGALNANDRAALQQQAQGILANIQDTLKSTTFAGQALLTEDNALSFQVGTEASSRVDVSTYDVESQFSSSGLFAVDFTDPAALSTALDAIDASLSTTGSLQAEYGAQQNAFSGRVDSLLTAQENEQAARSRIRDTDFAATISEQIVQRVLEQASVSVQAQANVSNNRALNLLTS